MAGIVRTYSLAHFTRPKDRPAALAGAVKWYGLRTAQTPYLGLWKESMCDDLGWETADPVDDDEIHPRSLIQNLPTWSWLPWDCIIGFVTALDDERKKRQLLQLMHYSEAWEGMPMTSTLTYPA
jgi:hypothetical protein